MDESTCKHCSASAVSLCGLFRDVSSAICRFGGWRLGGLVGLVGLGMVEPRDALERSIGVPYMSTCIKSVNICGCKLPSRC